MTDPGILSDEQPNLVEDPRKLFKLEPDRMGPEDPMEADFRAAEAGDQQAAMRLQRQLQTLPPGIARSRAQQRLTKAIASGVGQFGEPAPMLKPWWYVSKEAAPVSLQTLEDQLGALTGGLLGEGVGESGELLATESQRKLMDQGYGTGLAFETGLMEILPAREKYTDALKGFLVGTYGGVDAAIKTYQAEQQKRKDNREKAIQDLRYSRDWIRNTLVPGVVNDLEAGVGINTIRARINASNVQANRRLGIEIDNERKRRHAAQKPADASEQEWMSRFRPYADAFVGAGDTLADMAAELPEIGVVEDLGQSLENITGMAGQVFKNLNLSDLQDDYQTAAQLVRDSKPVPKEISDRIVAYEIQKLRRRTEGAGIVHDFTQSAGYAVDQYLGGKVFGKAVEAGGKLLGQAARLAPKTLGNIARGLGVAGDDVLKASMESSGFFRKLGDGLAKARTEVTLMSRAKELGVETVGTKAVGVAREVGRGLGAAAGEMGAVSVATGATSLAREGDLSEMRVGRAGMNALERQMAEELQVGIDPDTGRPTFAASEQPVSDSVRFSDIVDTADEYISERIGQFLPVVGRSPASKAAKRGQFLNLLRGSVAGRGVAEKLRKAAAGAADAVPIGGIFEELGEEYFKRGLDKAVGLVTGDERLSETEIIGGAEQIVDEFLRVSLNTVLMGGAREGMQQLGVRPSERRREKLYRQIESDIQEMDTNPEAAARVEQLLRNSRMPNPEAMSDVVFGELNAKPVDIDSLDDESRKRLTEFSQNHGVQVVPIQGAVAAEGAFSPNTPGVIYVGVDAVNDAGEWEAQTPAMVQAVATHEFVHDAQLLLGDRWVEVVERIKAKSPQAWDEAKRTYAEALGREEFAELTEGEQEQEAGAQIAEDNAVLLHALLNNDKIAGLIQQMGPMRGSDMTPGEVFLETVGRTLRLDFSGRKSAARAKKKLANILKQQGLTEQQARASYDIFTLMRDAVAARAAVRQNESKARFEGMEGQVSEEDLTLSPAEFERLLASEGASTTTVDPTAKPQGPTGIPAQEAALISPSLVPGVQELESQARGEGVTPQPAVEQEAMPAAEVSPTEGVIEDSTEFQMRNAAEAGRRLAVLRERLRAYSKREGMTARDRRTMQAIESEIAAIKARYPDTPVSVPEADLELELQVGAEARAARAEQQAQAEAEAAVQQQAQAEEAVRASTRMETDAPELPVTTGSRVRVEGQARRPKVAEEFEGPRRGAAILDDGQRVQRRTLVPLDTAMPVAVGATVRVRPGTPTQGRPVKTKSDQPLEVVRLTGPIGKQRAKLSDGRIVPVEGLRVVQQGPDATELAPEQLRQAQKAREDALRGRTRFSPRRDGSDANGVVPVIEGAERNKNFQKFVRRTKVRDDKGKPLVVYHGTTSPNDFSKFDRTSDIGYHFGTQEQAQSARFIGWAAKEGRSDAYYHEWEQSKSARVYPVYLDIRNPLIMPDLGSWPAKAVVDVLQNLSGRDAKAYAADYARSSGVPMPDRLLKAFKPIPVAVVEDIIDALDTFDGNKWEQPQARVMRVAYNEIIRKHLQNAGYDGIAYINEAEGDKPAPSYITFSSHQVKSIHNQGTFDATNPDIRKAPRRRRPKQPMDRFDMPEMTGFEQFQANWVNRLQRAEQFEEYLSSNGMQVVGEESAVSMMKRYPGRLRSQHEDLTNNFQRPIIQIMGDAGLTVEAVEDYLIARHTQEANRSLAERRGLAQQYREQAREIREFYNDEPDADIRSEKMREASNLEARAKKIDTREGAISYLTDQEAEDALKRMRESGDWESLEEIGALIDQMNAETRRKLLAGGLISQDQFDTWEKVFEHYVPFRDNDSMRGWSESSGYQDAKPVTHYRQGRVSRPSPLIFSFQQARSAINRSEKNKIGQRFVELLEKGNQVASMQRADESAPEPNWGSDQNAQSFSFKKNGDQMVVRIRDKDLARVFKNMDAAELGDFMQKVNSATRWMSNMNTQWNPAFLIPNAIRDGLTAGIIAGELRDKGWDVSRVAMAADTAKAIYAQLRPGRDAEMDDFIARYREAGGQIGWSDATDFETIASNIQKDLDKMADPALVKGARRMIQMSPIGWIEPLNLAVEQATRIAVFKASVEAGMSEADAAVTAREITVDFNRRGFKSHYINSAYMFFNAGLQGTVRSAKALTSSPTVQATAFGGILLGFFQDLWMAGSSDEDEDGRLEWDNTGAWEKYMNLHFPGGYKLPLPYLWNMFPAIGQALGQIYRGVTTVEEAALTVAGAAFDSLTPLSLPEFSWTGSALALTPSLLRPAVETMANMDYQGRDIYMNPFPGQYKPDSAMNPDAALSSVTKKLFEWTGGDPARKPGVLTADINPAAMQHIFEQYIGGMGKELMRFTKWDDPNSRPIIRRFKGVPNPYGVSSNFYELREAKQYAKQALKDAEDARDREGIRRIKTEYANLLRLDKTIEEAHKRARELYTQAQGEEDKARKEALIKKRDQILGRVVRRNDLFEQRK